MKLFRSLVILLISGMLFSTISQAAGWRVIPIRLDFDQRVRSGIITLINDNEQPVAFTVEAMEWTQDEQGKDQYRETGDLIFFPKTLTINPGEERVVRAGIKVPPLKQEKTYRLFIQEQPQKNETPGTAVAIAVRFGVPVFALPPRQDLRGEIATATLERGLLEFDARNTGNVHFRIDSTAVRGQNSKGEEIFSHDIQGWYLLANGGQHFTVEIPADVCRQLKTIGIQASGANLTFSKEIDVDPAQCQQP